MVAHRGEGHPQNAIWRDKMLVAAAWTEARQAIAGQGPADWIDDRRQVHHLVRKPVKWTTRVNSFA